MTRTSGKMTLTFDRNEYKNLLIEIVPKIIETEAEYEQALLIAERLTFSKNRTPEQTALHKLLVMLIENYETEQYPIPQSSPYQILLHIMEASGTSQADLVGLIGSSSVISELMNGNRAISQAQAKILGEMFKVSPNLFI